MSLLEFCGKSFLEVSIIFWWAHDMHQISSALLMLDESQCLFCMESWGVTQLIRSWVYFLMVISLSPLRITGGLLDSHKISQGANKLIRTSTVIKKKCLFCMGVLTKLYKEVMVLSRGIISLIVLICTRFDSLMKCIRNKIVGYKI